MLAKRPSVSLVALALLNLAIATAMDALAWSREGMHPAKGLFCVFCVFNGIFYGQATVLGTLAALAPKRGLIGLAGVCAYTLGVGYAMWLVHGSLLLPTRGVPFIGIFFAQLAITMQIVLFGARMLLGWRLVLEASNAQQPRGQFQLSDLVELTVLCAVWLGLNLALENDGVRGRVMVLVFARFIVSFLLLGVPILLALLAVNLPRGSIILGFALWFVLVDNGLAMIPIHDGDFIPTLIRQLPQHALTSCALVMAVAANGLLLRRIGLRWQLHRTGAGVG